MDWSRYSLMLIILLLAAGCRQSAANEPPTPTPFSSVGLADRAPIGEPIPISLTNLSANPELFEGATLQLRGQYQPLPRLICQGDAFPSPATWGLVGEGLQANATGLDQQLRQLIAEGQELTVEGRWLRYTGPIGCGKTAPVQELWYLSVIRIIDPHPLARATLALAVVDAEGVTILDEAPPTQTIAITEEAPEPLETVTLEATAVPPSPTYVPSPLPPAGPATALPGATVTLVSTPITATPAGTRPTATSTATISGGTPASGTGTPDGNTATPDGNTATPDGNTATPDGNTATPGGDTATPTATTTSSEGINHKGQIDWEELMMGSLASGAVDDWTITVDNSELITITVAPSSTSNMIFSVLDDNGQIILDKQNQAAAGEVETIDNLSLTEAGVYHIQISTDPAEQTDYALMVMDSESYNFSFRGTLAPDVQRSDSIAPDNDHFWFFPATDSETISLQVVPNGGADAYVELYGPDGSRLLTLDNGGSGETELLENHSILATGLYAVRVGEFDFLEMSYQIVVNKS